MEGLMLVPPERGTIIGRALWKPRYIILGSALRLQTPPENALPRATSTGRVATARKGLKGPLSKPSLANISEPIPEGLFISIYKAKGDWEFIAQHPISSFASCEVQSLQHRKQSPSVPTLIINLKPDAELERQRKRRSSRTGGLTSSKDPWASTLLFRTVPEEQHNIYDWSMAIKSILDALAPREDVLSPISPVFNNFTNPFASRDGRPMSSSQRPDLNRGYSSQTTSTYSTAPRMEARGERPSAVLSPSPSLRSRRSDLSSQASSQPMGFSTSHSQHYTTALPSDLPSPASTSGYETQFIEGWTSAQGRSSALSSHTRGSNSIASAVASGAVIASTPPGPRETILDRAFKNRVIPGSDRLQEADEDHLSSIARFEALMREAEERRENRMGGSSHENARDAQGWDLDEESEESDYEYAEEENEMEELEVEQEDDLVIPTPAQRALDYISGRATPHSHSSSHGRPQSPAPRSPPIPFVNQQAMSAFHANDGTDGLRPRTGGGSRPNSLAAIAPRSMSTATVPTLKDGTFPLISENEKRGSSNSVKRLSFSEFTRRLSSTSSLLLVQTNNSSSSGSQQSKPGSSETSGGVENEDSTRHVPRNSVNPRGGSSQSATEQRDKRCGWRGSVGVFGNEGGFV
ncbi:hypothetical protein BP5796_00089 [Coleophoma crateriformis]|uniref:Uncharacterized protein n=1 Tax=Coleophoma crateriformis TaxID=565419 RepID=A0A3D8T701_9HELO|nr:hypothetical protein BP5796_00089 [Coleophoma crateriformis]